MVTHFFRGFLLSTAALGLGLTASAQASGKIDAMSDDIGSVIVTRGGATYTLSAGDAVFSGDRITTRSNGHATISANGCIQVLGAESSAIVNDDFCDVDVVALSSGPDTGASELAEADTRSLAATRGLIAMGAFTAVGAIAVVAGATDEPASTPTSP